MVNNQVLEVVVILPYVGTKVLMQLRDPKPDIAFPSRWGFFGGSLSEGEIPQQAAERELLEELGYESKVFYDLGREVITDADQLVSYAFACPLLTSPELLVQKEGLDLTLASLTEVQEKRIYSPKLRRYFPVAETYYIPKTFFRLLDYLSQGT